MITFDGIDLSSIAPVRIEDIRVSPVTLDIVTRDRVAQAGNTYIRTRCATRTVTVTFALLVSDPMLRSQQLRYITQWAQIGRECKLQLSTVPLGYLMARCKSLPEPSLRQWWESKLRIVFECYENPFWNSVVQHEVNCGMAFMVQGDAPPIMGISCTRSSEQSNQTYSRGEETMTFSSIPAGTMFIDLNRQTAEIAGVSIMPHYTFGSRFITPQTGTQTILGNGKVIYRERWI